jgi:hypothetical protein
MYNIVGGFITMRFADIFADVHVQDMAATDSDHQ